MNLTIERNCDQCGGEMEICETDTLIECPWCGVRHFLDTQEARYVLPHKEMKGELIHVPYLRIKGSLFTCDLSGVHHKVVDTTIGATKINALPPTLGVRPQTMKLRLATQSLKTTYLRHHLKWQDAVDHAATVQHLVTKSTLHKEWIGETFSTIYQPLILQDNVVLDGFTGEKIAKLPKDRDIFAPIRMDKLDWQTTLLPTLCPNCGWDMPSGAASVIHLCPNCDTAWHNNNGIFKNVPYATVLSAKADTIYLPFWQMRMDFKGIKLDNLADFIRTTNIPRIIKPEWKDEKVSFFCPAFKIRPKIFLRLASQLTSAQQPMHSEQTLPNSTTTPVSLTKKDAQDSIKIILAHTAVAKRNVTPLLPDIGITNIRTKLLFLPFFDNGYELCQEKLKITINKQILEWGKKL